MSALFVLFPLEPKGVTDGCSLWPSGVVVTPCILSVLFVFRDAHRFFWRRVQKLVFSRAPCHAGALLQIIYGHQGL